MAFYNNDCVEKNPELAKLRTIGQRVRHWRKVRGMTQKQLAKASGLAASTIGDLERDRQATSGNLAQVARALKINATYLAENVGDPENLNGPLAAEIKSSSDSKYQFDAEIADLEENDQDLAWLRWKEVVAEIREKRQRPSRRRKIS